MAAATRIISLNLGSQSIELAEFHARPHDRLTLSGYHFREVLDDPTGEGMQRPQIVAALREMLDELQIKSGNVNYAIAEQSVFARFVKLPAVGEEKIERIISFEAQQNVPFPIDEVVWDYQLVGGGAQEQIQVVLVAIKADLLDEINGAVEETGLRTSIVDVATMALYNAFRYKLQRSNRVFVAGRYRGAHNQSAFHRAGKNFLAQYSNRWRLDHVGHCQGVQRTIHRS